MRHGKGKLGLLSRSQEGWVRRGVREGWDVRRRVSVAE